MGACTSKTTAHVKAGTSSEERGVCDTSWACPLRTHGGGVVWRILRATSYCLLQVQYIRHLVLP